MSCLGFKVNVPGNVTSHAEFNFYSDPEAARLVLSSGVPLTLVDLGACRQVAIEREEAERLKASKPLGKLVAQLLNNWFRRDPIRKQFAFYDPLALAAALDPEIVTTRSVTMRVEAADPERLGASLVTGGAGAVAVAQRVDVLRFFALFESLLGLERAAGR